jgi:hypothetical protein
MLKVLIIFLSMLLSFNYVKADALDAFLTGVLKGLNKNMQKDNAKNRIKGSKDDYKILDSFSGCVNYVETQEKYFQLNYKSPFPSNMSVSHMIDKTYPTQDESDLIIAYIQEIEECINRSNPNKIKNKSVKSLFLTSQIIWSENILDFIKLYNRQINWGTLNTNIKERSNQYLSYVNNWEIATDAQLQMEYNNINNYWSDWDYQRRKEQQQILNSYLNKNKNRCWKKEVYDSKGNKKYVKTCGNPYMMDVN